ncbi:MAG: response regulator [Phycisphaeraceae bacterium]|nr:response regulator [Phycisphaeraceae bacterium]
MLDVLVIDDNPAVQRAMSARLEANGVQLRAASSGAEGLAEVEKALPDAVLLDIRMPGMSGLQVCERLREKYDAKALPIIFVSAETSKKAKTKARDLQGNCYLSKPYEAQDLVAAVLGVTGYIQETESKRGRKS